MSFPLHSTATPQPRPLFRNWLRILLRSLSAIILCSDLPWSSHNYLTHHHTYCNFLCPPSRGQIFTTTRNVTDSKATIIP